MRLADQETARRGVPTLTLMHRAGECLAVRAMEVMERHGLPRAVILCGRGNNGGDGLAAGRLLLGKGIGTTLHLLTDPSTLGDDPRAVLGELREAGVPLTVTPPEALAASLAALPAPYLLVDALFGTGFRPPARPPWDGVIRAVNAAGQPVLAADLPSGLDADTGRVTGETVQATWTVTFGLPKPALFVHPAAARAGEVTVAGIGHPPGVLEEAEAGALLVEGSLARTMYRPRPAGGHKGTFGHLLVVAGSRRYPGAALLAALGGVRSGAGLVTLAAPGSLAVTLAHHLPEVIPAPLPATPGGSFSPSAPEAMEALLEGKGGVVCGPGLGMEPESAGVVRALVTRCPSPLLLDADALNHLAEQPGTLEERRHPTVLTPHPGEMARLLGASASDIGDDRLGALRRAAGAFPHTIVLKGAGTLTAAPGSPPLVNPTGNPGMASGGMGDVLAGLVGGLLAQGYPPLQAAALGVYLHGLAGDLASREMGPQGFGAREVADRVPAALAALLHGHEDLRRR
jgi:NAD(P)H-hydrate epimerase